MADSLVLGSPQESCAEAWLARLRQFDWSAELKRCYDNAAFLTEELSAAGITAARQHINVLMQRPSDELATRWQLMCVDEEAQIFCMPHLDRADLCRFAHEMKAEMLTHRLYEPTVRLSAVSGMLLASSRDHSEMGAAGGA
eukprot:CAMPEP_0115471256 /NCGR_PEP_ID=MMETSP0271-20121206/52429_1 /TAXON_ID=71861 /ORGANISM="Scrippsiella trochoidea, Strain CCMP3099" /LENGTH=140 /DNA_ID=CAMNT_0002898435 /DNA_START=41 /DNA_END=463 /DNA_ORIENTATION=+